MRRLPAGIRRLPPRVRLAAAIEALPETDRLVLTLRLVEGLSALEAAGAMRLRVTEVEKRTASSLMALARELAARVPLRRAA
jgi:DNA-directed RNA polymerase specialized sigma24 family protein